MFGLPHNWPDRARVALSALLIVALLAGGIATAIPAHQEARLPVDVTVVSVGDPVKTEPHPTLSVYSARVQLDHHGSEPVEIGIWSYSEAQKAYAIWPVNGTDRTITLMPGETRTVTVEAPNYDASIRVPPEDGIYAVWTALSTDGQRRAHDLHKVTNDSS